MTQFIKKIIPQALLKIIRPFYHGLVALLANIYFGNPSGQMVVIGVTGTAGKSTTVQMLAWILNNQVIAKDKKQAGAGFITTISFFDGQAEHVNKHGLSMPGGWLLQKQLRQMAGQGCKYAIVECTSEGLAQNRHLGINFDMALFTNLSRAHLEAHGSFGNYQAAKSKLFGALGQSSKKSFFNKKMIGVNIDDPASGFFLSHQADVKFGTTFNNVKLLNAEKVFSARLIQNGPPTKLSVDGTEFSLNILGSFNAQNAALAFAAASMLGFTAQECAAALNNFHGARGRMESVSNSLGLNIIVDYGCEPASFRAALEAASLLPHNRLIHVFGSTGGHRDAEKRFAFGKLSASIADYIFITNDDVYDSDPKEIARNIEQGIKEFKLRQPGYEVILDRREAIKKALSLAKPGDIVLITGKGSEQFLVLPGNKRINWDEVRAVREEIGKLTTNN